MNDPEFDACLSDLESSDATRRRRGVLTLERFHEPRALIVAKALLEDPDSDIRTYAKGVYETLLNVGVKAKAAASEKAPKNRRGVETLNSVVEILDEVFFAIRRNLRDLVYTSCVSGLPKILLGVFLLSMPVFIGNSALPRQSDYLLQVVVLFALHQFLVRPFIWLTVGKAFLTGMMQGTARQACRVSINLTNYLSLLQAQVPLALPWVLAVFFYLSSDGRGDAVFLGLAGLLGLTWIHYASLTVMPINLLNAGVPGGTGLTGMSIYAEESATLRAVYPTYLIFKALLYVILVANLVFLLRLLTGVRTDDLFLGSFLIADALTEPFSVGFRTMVTVILAEKPGR